MKNLRVRLEKAESEVRFKFWIRYQRMLEDLCEDELQVLARTGQWPDRPEPAQGMSRFDNMDRPSLIELWKQEQERWLGRTRGANGILRGAWSLARAGLQQKMPSEGSLWLNPPEDQDISKSRKDLKGCSPTKQAFNCHDGFHGNTVFSLRGALSGGWIWQTSRRLSLRAGRRLLCACARGLSACDSLLRAACTPHKNAELRWSVRPSATKAATTSSTLELAEFTSELFRARPAGRQPRSVNALGPTGASASCIAIL